ncbi:MAG: hypothetical protein LBE38_06155 [Deltaproteobacteria bacterium]|nr:hypothetical protein [Deltaproteobacteria bacterium]
MATFEALELLDDLLKYYKKLGVSIPVEVRVRESLTNLFRRRFPRQWTFRSIRQHVKCCETELLQDTLDAGRARGAYSVVEKGNTRHRLVVYWSVKSLGLVCPINYDYLKSLLKGLERALGLSFDGDGLCDYKGHALFSSIRGYEFIKRANLSLWDGKFFEFRGEVFKEAGLYGICPIFMDKKWYGGGLCREEV